MRAHAAAAFVFAFTLAACAQHGGNIGSAQAGFAGRSAPVAPSPQSAPHFPSQFAPPVRGTFAAPLAPRFPGASAPRSFTGPMRPIAPVRYPANRPAFYHPSHDGHSDHHISFQSYPPYAYGYGYGLAYGVFPSVVYDTTAGLLNDYDWFDAMQDASQQPAPAAPDSGYAEPPPQPESAYAYPQAAPAYPTQPQPAPQIVYAYPAPPADQGNTPPPAAPQMQYVPGSTDRVTLIYRDGRPPEEIQNYLATRTNLTILDGGRRRTIALSDLDIPATMRANRQTGVDFTLPSLPGTTGCTGICAPESGNP